MMPDLHGLGKALFPKPDDIVAKGLGGVIPATTVEAYATSDSEDGTVLVDFGGEAYGDEGQSVSIPTSSAVKTGQRVLVTVQGNVPVDCAVIGEGDSIRDNVVAHFWHDSDGAHVTTLENDATQGGNVLIDTDSVDIRDGETVIARFSAEKDDYETTMTLAMPVLRNAGIVASETSSEWSLDINAGTVMGAKSASLTVSANGSQGDSGISMTDAGITAWQGSGTYPNVRNISRDLGFATFHGNISSQSGAQAQFATNGFCATLTLGSDTTPSGQWGSKTLCTIPEAYRPPMTVYFPVAKTGSAQSSSYVIVDSSTGVVTLQNWGGTQSSVQYFCTCTWCY